MAKLSLNKIRRDGGTQIRLGMSQETIDGYAEEMRVGTAFPPIVVFYDGKHHWLADGFQRTLARAQAGFDTVDADIRKGTQRDAVLYACGANAEHGLRRTNEDKRRAVETLLRDEEWAKWSDNAIAKVCKVSNHFVAKTKASLGTLQVTAAPEPSAPRKYTTKHGTEAVMNTANIGRRKKTKEPLSFERDASNSDCLERQTIREDWDPHDFLHDVRMQIHRWSRTWLEHASSVAPLVQSIQLAIDLISKEELRDVELRNVEDR